MLDRVDQVKSFLELLAVHLQQDIPLLQSRPLGIGIRQHPLDKQPLAVLDLFEHDTDQDRLLGEILVFYIGQKIVRDHGEVRDLNVHHAILLVRRDVDLLVADQDIGGRQAAERPAGNAEAVVDVVAAGADQQVTALPLRTGQVIGYRLGHGLVPQGLGAEETVRGEAAVAVVAEDRQGLGSLVGVGQVEGWDLRLLIG